MIPVELDRRTCRRVRHIPNCRPIDTEQTCHCSASRTAECTSSRSHPARDERSLQRLVETNLLEALGIHFLASEYQIGPGRHLDTLGIDENGSPTIIEYKRDRHHGVINQALSYLKWLRNQRREFFDRLVERALPDGTTGQVDWGTRDWCASLRAAAATTLTAWR